MEGSQTERLLDHLTGRHMWGFPVDQAQEVNTAISPRVKEETKTEMMTATVMERGPSSWEPGMHFLMEAPSQGWRS